jgi:hypothetical protein
MPSATARYSALPWWTARRKVSGGSSRTASRSAAWTAPAGDLRRPPGPDSSDQAHVPGLLLAALPGALPAQPALPRAQSRPGHGGRREESGVRHPGTRSGARPLAAGHRDAAQVVPHSCTSD